MPTKGLWGNETSMATRSALMQMPVLPGVPGRAAKVTPAAYDGAIVARQGTSAHNGQFERSFNQVTDEYPTVHIGGSGAGLRLL